MVSKINFTKEYFKILFIGALNTGKTTTIYKLLQEKTFNYPTIGIECNEFIKEINGKDICVKILDIAGNLIHENIINLYLQELNLIAIFYDISQLETLEIAEFLINKYCFLKINYDFRKNYGKI